MISFNYHSLFRRTVIAGLETPLSEIVKVLKARMEGIGLNAAARVFGYAKTTILNCHSLFRRTQY
jgi:hypothetical protein